MGSEEAFARVERELLEERAAALARIAGRLESLVARLATAREEWRQRPSEARHPDALERYRHLRDEARLYRWYLDVQRDALGLRSHEGLDGLYPIPESLEG